MGTLHASNLFYRKIFVFSNNLVIFSNKHFIAPVEITFRCTGKPLNLQLTASHLNFFFQTQKFLLNKNGDTEKFVSVIQWNYCCKFSLSLSIDRWIDRSINLINIWKTVLHVQARIQKFFKGGG